MAVAAHDPSVILCGVAYSGSGKAGCSSLEHGITKRLVEGQTIKVVQHDLCGVLVSEPAELVYRADKPVRLVPNQAPPWRLHSPFADQAAHTQRGCLVPNQPNWLIGSISQLGWFGTKPPLEQASSFILVEVDHSM